MSIEDERFWCPDCLKERLPGLRCTWCQSGKLAINEEEAAWINESQIPRDQLWERLRARRQGWEVA